MKIAVVGDVLLDVDMFGNVDPLCSDASVPVILVEETVYHAGGAGRVASMLVEDGEEVLLITALSTDEWAGKIRAALAGVAITAAPLLGPTPVRTMLRAAGRALVRIDTGCGKVPVPEFFDYMLSALDGVDAIVVADHGRGVTSIPLLRSRLEELASRIPIVWNPHPSGAEPVAGVASVTPSAAAAARFSGIPTNGATSAAASAERLLDRWSSGSVVVTGGELGTLLMERSEDRGSGSGSRVPKVMPAPSVFVEDPCGAGDRFAASLALRLAAHESMPEAVQRAVEEAAQVLTSEGVAPSSRAGSAEAGPG